MPDQHVSRIASGAFRVSTGDTHATVYVAGPPSDRWAFWNGYVFRLTDRGVRSGSPVAVTRAPVATSLTAPMPATVIKVLVVQGAHVAKGETVVLLEAMKMELPIRAATDATVTAVRCREGELVGADQPLIDLA
jgi:acetyl/propionyl-CoA carboxylase alpha subunit